LRFGSGVDVVDDEKVVVVVMMVMVMVMVDAKR
jgi:hypothetical protein